MSKDIFENLVTDITAQVLQKVQQQITPLIANAVNARLENLVDTGYITNTIQERINHAVVQYQPDLSVVEKNIDTITANWANLVSADLNLRVDKILNERVGTMDISNLISEHIQNKLDPSTRTYPFPEKSIGVKSIATDDLRISGDQIIGGVITNFGSTGIDDKATECKVTILDHGTVFENTLYAPSIEVKGGAIIDGDLTILGNITDNPAYRKLVEDVSTDTKTTITDEVLARHQEVILKRMLEDGIDIGKVSLQGRVILEGDRLLGVINSQLRTVGVLQDLQTSGDTLLSDTFFTANKRVGINTMEPKTALSIWDEEIEFGLGKYRKGVARLGVERDTMLVIGANGRDNLTLLSDGVVAVEKLKINNLTFTTSPIPPAFDAPKGLIVFNENPSLGGPLGWVSLGDARWANFGIID